MTVQTPRRRFLTYLVLVLAVVAVIFAVTRVMNTAADHDPAPAPIASPG